MEVFAVKLEWMMQAIEVRNILIETVSLLICC